MAERLRVHFWELPRHELCVSHHCNLHCCSGRGEGNCLCEQGYQTVWRQRGCPSKCLPWEEHERHKLEFIYYTYDSYFLKAMTSLLVDPEFSKQGCFKNLGAFPVWFSLYPSIHPWVDHYGQTWQSCYVTAWTWYIIRAMVWLADRIRTPVLRSVHMVYSQIPVQPFENKNWWRWSWQIFDWRPHFSHPEFF